MPPPPKREFEEPRFSLNGLAPTSSDPWRRKAPNDNDRLFQMPMDFKTGQKVPTTEQGFLDYKHVLAQNFILSHHDAEGAGDGEHWEAGRMLGEGGFARVGVWNKVSATGEVIDEIAIKEAKLVADPAETEGHDVGMSKLNYVGLGFHREAILQLDLQQKEKSRILSADASLDLHVDLDRHVLRLRQYKFNPEQDKCRMYLEYCAHGSLAALVEDYRAFDQDLPVRFLWYIFYSLAKAIDVMNDRLLDEAFLYECRIKRGEPEWQDGEHCVIHNDIKALNILLAYSDDEWNGKDDPYKIQDDDMTKSFPSIKLADFGVSYYTSSVDKKNPPLQQGGGTRSGMPPEQIRCGMKFKDPPNWQGERFNAKHMVWQIAKVIWDAAMHWKRIRIHKQMRDLEESSYKANGNHFIEQKYCDNYPDKDLAELLRQCMTPYVGDRPSTAELVNKTRDGLKKSLAQDEPSRLYFRGREVKDMPYRHKNPRFTAVMDDYISVRFRDPNDLVDMPKRKWGEYRKRERQQLEQYAEEASLDIEAYIHIAEEEKRLEESRKKALRQLEEVLKDDKGKRDRQRLLDMAKKGNDEEEEEPEVNDAAARRKNIIRRLPDSSEEVEPEVNDGDVDNSKSPTPAPATDNGNVAPLRSRSPTPTPPPNSPLPTTQDYLDLKNDELLAEMKARDVVLAKGVRKVKASYARALRDADQAGNKGNGAKGKQGKGKDGLNKAQGAGVAKSAASGKKGKGGRAAQAVVPTREFRPRKAKGGR